VRRIAAAEAVPEGHSTGYQWVEEVRLPYFKNGTDDENIDY